MIKTIEPAYLPNQALSILIDWKITLKCNYDCSYCSTTWGHNNKIPHPDVETCVKMLSQMYRYVDVVSKYKKPKSRKAVLNLLGGEVLYHPDVETILKKSSELYQPYADKWHLDRRLTTNATASLDKWKLVCQHIEGVTVSYHSEGPDKLKDNVKQNILYMKKIKKKFDLIVLMHNHDKYWKDCIQFIEWCKTHDVIFRPRLLDGGFQYSVEQKKYLEHYYKNINKDKTQTGRACCGGRQLCFNRNLRDRNDYFPQTTNFKGWYCSVNWFFLTSNAMTKQFFTNRDCHNKLDGTLGPIADIDTMDEYTDRFDQMIEQGHLPVIKCQQERCACGLCAPKSQSAKELHDIVSVYLQPAGLENFIPKEN